jgi:hypothetical protein
VLFLLYVKGERKKKSIHAQSSLGWIAKKMKIFFRLSPFFLSFLILAKEKTAVSWLI